MSPAPPQQLARAQTSPSRGWEPRQLLRGVAVILLGAVIVGFPAHSLPKPGMARFGWQMFAMSRPAAEFTVTDRSGSETEVSTSELAAKIRPDVDYVVPGAQWICAHDPEALQVRATIENRDAGTFSCADF